MKRRICLTSVMLFIYTLLNAQNFSPALYQPDLWLDASDTSSVIHSNGEVSLWNDKSGFNNHVNQSTQVNQPLYISTAEGIRFDGLDDVLIGNNLLYGTDTTLTLFIVAAPEPGSEKGSVIAKGQWTSGNDYRIELGENGYDICLQGAREWNSSASDWNIAHKNLVYTSYDSLKSVHYYLNGAIQELPRREVAYNPNNSPFSIGGRFNYSDFFKGNIFEVILFRKSLSICEVNHLEGYLYHKWGLQSQIISNHSYKEYNFGICDEYKMWIDENTAEGTIVGTIEGNYVDTSVVFSDWRIEDGGLFPATYTLSSQGVLTISDNQNLDFEESTSHYIRVSAKVNNLRVYGGIRININDLDDGDPIKTHSTLWGEEGERWDPRGRLADFSYVGYKNGEAGYHYVQDTANVMDFGAIATDSLSDVTAIMDAIASIDSGIVFFPAGLYVIDDYITISKDKIVLMGESNDSISGTRFYLPKHSTELSNTYSYLINFTGSLAGPSYDITENVKMGDRSITLQNTSGLEVGDIVDINFAGTHPADGELWDHILNGQNYDWPCSVAWSNGNGGLLMHHTIERIEGMIVTLKEPIRLDLNLDWNPRATLRTDWYIKECGIENVFIAHKYIPQPPHLQEPGYNSISFSRAINCWVKNVSIKDADNGLRFDVSTLCEIRDISFYGRGGHHGWTFAYSSHCLAEDIHFGNYEPWTHSFTLTHKSSGNVISDVTGKPGIDISTDFHRNTPWETLITNVQNDWSYASSGVWCAGPNAGKRTVYWNMGGGFSSYPLWDDYQTTLVGEMNIREVFHPDKGWHENVNSLAPANLYQAQLERRLNLPQDQAFCIGSTTCNRDEYWERDPSRWRIEEDEYTLFFSNVPTLTGNRPGEYTILDSIHNGDMMITVDIRSLENSQLNPSADAIVILNFQDDENYYYWKISSENGAGGIYLVENGVSNLLLSLDAVYSMSFASYSFSNISNQLSAYRNGQLLGAVTDNVFNGGRVGFGSMDDAASFDNIRLDSCPSYLLIQNQTIDLDQEFRAGIRIELDNVTISAADIDLIAPKIEFSNESSINSSVLLTLINQNGCL